ncbi:Autotransporter beta-domain containing protein [Methylophilaceae bacterium]
MRKVFSLSQCFLFCLTILFSFKSFAADCPPGGINSSGINYSITCSGDITMSDAIVQGIKFYNSDSISHTNTVNMTGNITTSGNYSYGINLVNSSGTNINTFNMTGNITTSGTVANGISLYNSSVTSNINTVNMTGNITSNFIGISLWNNSSTSNTQTVNMTGNITMSGANTYGISLDNTSTASNNTNTVNMTGDIMTSGATAYGIYLNNSITSNTNINTVNISGRISATGSSYAIYANNDDSTSSNTVWLNKGTSVSGRILGEGAYTANNFLKLNLGAGASYGFALTGFTVTDLNDRPMVIGSAYAAGIGNVVTASQSLYERTSQITQSLDDRLRTYDLEKNTDQPYWINTYYSDSSRGGQGLSGSNLSFNQYRSGITAGFDVKNTFTPTEFIVNYEHGKLNIDEGNQGISSNSIMAGALFPDVVKVFSGTLSAKALVGYSDFSGDRKVLTNDVAYNGSRNVTASYQSTNVTIGSAWTKTLYQTDKIILDTLVGVDLNTQHINSYSESDLFKWSGRTINQLQERVSLGMEIKPMVNPLTLYGRVGIERRDLLSGENQNFAINNTAVSYNDSNQRNTYATLNAGAYYPLTPMIKAYAQVRYYDSDKNIDSLSGNIGISGQF